MGPVNVETRVVGLRNTRKLKQARLSGSQVQPWFIDCVWSINTRQNLRSAVLTGGD